MSINCNGYSEVEKEECGTGETVHTKGFRESNSESDLDEVFRGFVKVPLVKLEKLDITPFLKDKAKRKLCQKGSNDVLNIHKRRLSQICTVKLFRDDLAKLKSSLSGSNSDQEFQNPADMVITCRICKKSYTSIRKLQNHQNKKHIILKTNSKPTKRVSFSDHVIIHEVTEYHKCRKCPKIFEDYKCLKSHMKQVHRKRKCYICNYCSKKFADRSIFKIHIKLHCDNCGSLLPNKIQLLQHRRDICRVFKLTKCTTCQLSFFNIMHLKDHSYDHTVSSLICDICRDNFSSKCMLAHHIAFLHSNNRPTALHNTLKVGNERLYVCKFCEHSSVEKENLENHTSQLPDLSNKAMTGYKDYYFCDQCLKRYKTEQEMLQHKWTHFLANKQTVNVPKRLLKTTYNVNESLPAYLKPVVKLEKLKEPKDQGDHISKMLYMINNNDLKVPLVDKKSKKTLLSQFQCEICTKYFSSRYCLNRHIAQIHGNYDNFNSLQCKMCEETFVWPSLLQSHNCIRLNLPELPFDDARPEIQFVNLNEEFPTLEDDYMNSVDFEIPAPIVELTEYNDSVNLDCQRQRQPVQSLGYKVVMQEVPIEF